MPRIAPGRHTLILLALTLAVLMMASVVLSGCGDNSPGGAVGKLLRAWQDMDWDAYKASVVPAERNLSKDQEALAKQKFEQIRLKYDDIGMKTTYDPKDKNKATVVLVSGKITVKAKILGEYKTETKDVRELTDEEKTFETLKVDGVWYVNTKLG